MMRYLACVALILGAPEMALSQVSIVTGPTANAASATTGGNTASATQTGSGNAAEAMQSGHGNVASIVQHGAGNRSVVRQHGSGGSVTHEQEGNGRDAVITQSGSPAGRITIAHFFVSQDSIIDSHFVKDRCKSLCDLLRALVETTRASHPKKNIR